MEKETVKRLTQDLIAFSGRNSRSWAFDEDDFATTFETISPFVTTVIVEYREFSMFRSRATWHNCDFEHISQIGYRRADKVTEYSRCNKPGESILYAASDPETSFLEVDFSENKPCAVIAQFRLKAGETLRLLPIGELDHFRRHHRARVQASGADELLEKQLAPLDHYESITRQFVDAYLADYMGRIPHKVYERNLYEVTSRISGTLLSPPGVDGLIYPSVMHHGGLNYAIKPAVFDAKFEIQKYLLTGELYNHGYGLFEHLVEADGSQLNESGQFIWQRKNWHSNARSTWPLSAEQ